MDISQSNLNKFMPHYWEVFYYYCWLLLIVHFVWNLFLFYFILCSLMEATLSEFLLYKSFEEIDKLVWSVSYIVSVLHII